MKKVLLPLLAIGGALALQPALAQDGEALFKSKPCAAGHIKNGSQGVWGPIPMPPNPVTEEEAKILAEWVLSQK